MELEVCLCVAPLVVPVELVAEAASERREAEKDGEDGGRQRVWRHPHCLVLSDDGAFPGGIMLSRQVCAMAR